MFLIDKESYCLIGNLLLNVAFYLLGSLCHHYLIFSLPCSRILIYVVHVGMLLLLDLSSDVWYPYNSV